MDRKLGPNASAAPKSRKKENPEVYTRQRT